MGSIPLKKYEIGITGFDIAKDISTSLSKKAVAVKVDGQQKDLIDPIIVDSSVSIITIDDSEGLEIMHNL